MIKTEFSPTQELVHIDEGLLRSLSVQTIPLGQWVLLQRDAAELVLNDEPYIGIQLLVEMETKRYIHRVWGKTKLFGQWATSEDLALLCRSTFENTLPCVGISEDHPAYQTCCEKDLGVHALYPVQRLMASDCLQTTQSNKIGSGLCVNCEVMLGESSKGNEETDTEWGRDMDATHFLAQPVLPKRDASDDSPWAQTTNEGGVVSEEKQKPKKPRAKRKRVQKPKEPSESFGTDESENAKRRRIEGNHDYLLNPQPCEVQSGIQLVLHEDGSVRRKCPECGLLLKSRTGMKEHRMREHMWGEFKCQHCGKEADFIGKLFEHHKEDHTGLIFNCTLCNMCIDSKWSREEVEQHHKSCKYNKLVKARKDSYQGNRFKCEKCVKTFPLSWMLKEHMDMHDGKPPKQCEKCSFTTYCSRMMKTHLNRHLREEGQLVDDQGRSIFFPCDICEKSFTKKFDLQKHINRDHFGQAAFQCEKCPQTFKFENTLARHRFKEHGIGGCTCHVCGTSVGSMQDLRVHLRYHEPPKHFCKYCGKGLMTATSLRTHELQHTGENPVSCDMCDYKCKSTTVLRKHKIFKHHVD